MNSFVYFDYCALIVEALIIVSLIIRKMTRGRVNRWAFALITDIIITTIADIGGLTLEAIGPGNIGWKYISNTVVLWGTCMTSVIFCGYLFAMIGIWHKIKERKILSYIYNIPVVLITAALVVVNPFTKLFFYIDGNGFYARGVAFYSLYALSYLYIFVAYFELIRYRRLFSFMKLFSVFMVFFMNVIASIVQGAIPQYYVQMFCGISHDGVWCPVAGRAHARYDRPVLDQCLCPGYK